MTRVPAWRRRRELPFWKRWLPAIVGLLILLLAPVLCYAQGSVTLVWTAPGDDGGIGTASNYEMRRSQAPITTSNWAQATLVPGLSAPQPAGTRQSVLVQGLTEGVTYYFAIRTEDNAGNWSPLSNVLRWDWVFDTAPPAAPAGVSAVRQGDAVHVRWSANSEPDVAGYFVYRAESQGAGPARITQTLVTGTEYVDSNLPATTHVWYEVSAIDESGNESARSATFVVSLTPGAAEWAIEPGYPNPSSTLATVTIPLNVPASGAGGAVIDILDSGGSRVRRVDLAGLSAGAQNVSWDGRNDAGRYVARGVYRAWLIAGDVRQTIRLVRVP